ncbi:hypothetical protein SVAN01_08798 [Stagonosporopsis vannaccii]|nr:hypothetical protein SVAN01_08798 [Stagonosporopsis vannaccii]
MRDHIDQQYPVQAGVHGLMDATSSEEEVNTSSSYQYNEMWNTASMTGGFPVHAHQAIGQPEGYLQGVGQHQVLSHTPIQGAGGDQCEIDQIHGHGTDSPSSFGYINRAQPLEQGPWYGQGPGLTMGDLQVYGAPADGQSISQAYSNTQSGGQHGVTETFNHEYDTPADGMYNQPGSMPVHQHIDSRDIVAVSLSPSTMSGDYTSGLDSAFVPGVLNRYPGHQDQLGVYIDRLVARLRTNVVTTPTANSNPHNSLMVDRQAAIVTRPFLHTIQARWSQEMGPVNMIPITGDIALDCMVGEGSSVMVGPDASDVQSWMTPDSAVLPDASSRVSDAPPPTDIEVCSEVFYCPFAECGAKFTGRYGKGNLGRHRRHKHGGQVVALSCEDENCSKVFRRQDARLKHYHNNHPYLSRAHAMSRTTSSSYAGFLGPPFAYNDGG